MKRFITMLVCSLIFTNALATSQYPAVENYAAKLLNNTISILQSPNSSLQTKISEAEKLMNPNLDIDWMAKYVLGRYRKQLSTQQIDEFSAVYSKYLIKSYSHNIKEYKNQKVSITSVTQVKDKEYVVKTKLIAVGNASQNIQIDYLVREVSDNNFKVFDIITEGISLLGSHQAEFADTITHKGFTTLVNDLNEKVTHIN